MKIINALAVTILSIVFLQACNDDDDHVIPASAQQPVVQQPTATMSLVDVAVDNGSFTTLVSALQATGLDTVLADLDTNYTVFAPTDDAFGKLPDGTLDSLSNEQLTNILLYHVLAGKVEAEAAINLAQSEQNQAETAAEMNIALSLVNDMLYINNAKVTAADVMADNGVIHVVDTVILPPMPIDMSDMTIVDVALADPENFSSLVDALSAADLVSVLADKTATFTVFAPTNAAFAKVDSEALNALLADTSALTNVLLTHVVADTAIGSVDAYAAIGKMVTTASGTSINVEIDTETGMLMVGGAGIVTKDIVTSNGVIHVIDTVILE